MSDRYKINEQDGAYFITMTVVNLINIFTRKEQIQIIIDSLKHCQKEKELEIYGWCLMPSHLHIICRAGGKIGMSAILRDFKKYTSKKIVKQIIEESESENEWILQQFKDACKYLKRKQEYKVWQDSNHAKIIFTNNFFHQKLNYIHQNPVEAMLVANPEDYLYSSARNYAELDCCLEIIIETRKLIIAR